MTGTLETIRGALQGTNVRWVLTDSTDRKVLLNVTQDYSREWPGTISDRPVEDGTTVTDHIRLGPSRIDATVLLTPTTSIRLVTIKTDVDERAQILIDWWKTAEFLKLTGKGPEITDLLIENLTERKSSDLRDSRMFDISLREVELVDTTAISEAGAARVANETEETPQ